MTHRARLRILAAVGTALIAGLSFLVFRGKPSDPQRPDEGAAPPPRVEGTPAKDLPSPRAPARPAQLAAWTISGRVVRDGAIVPGVALILRPGSDSGAEGHARAGGIRAGATGEDGRFVFGGIPPQSPIILEVDEPSSALRPLEIFLNEGSGESHLDLGDLVLAPPSTLIVKLLGPEVAPIEDGTVSVLRVDPIEAGCSPAAAILEAGRPAEHRGRGEHVLGRVPPGRVSIEARAPGYAWKAVSTTVPRKDPLIVRLVEGGRIVGILCETAGEAVAGALVTARGCDGARSYAVRSDASGRFAFDFLARGSFDVEVDAIGHERTLIENVQTDAGEVKVILPREAVLSGRVVREDGLPVEKAWISIDLPDGRGAWTGREGEFELDGLPPGKYAVQAFHSELVAHGEAPEVKLGKGQHAVAPVIRMRPGIEVAGVVVEAGTKKPIAAAQVHLYPPLVEEPGPHPPGEAKIAITGPDGRFTLKGLREKVYGASVAARGYLCPRGLKVAIPPSPEPSLLFTLERGRKLSGRVSDAGGNPVEGAGVEVRMNFLEEEEFLRFQDHRTRTDAEGRFLLEGLPPNPAYLVLARKEGHAFGWTEQVDTEGDVEGIEIWLEKAGTVRGRAADEHGLGVGEAAITIEPTGFLCVIPPEVSMVDAYGPSSAVPDADGRFEIRDIPAGRYWIRGEARGRLDAGKEVRVVAGSLESVDLVLHRETKVTGRVVDPAGNAVPRARVLVGPRVDSTQTDDEGRFEVTCPAAEAILVSVDHPDFKRRSAWIRFPETDKAVLALEPRQSIIIDLSPEAKRDER